ncbi:MAG: c-type cytochrome domain-containing protein [Planctomycetota bacterium]
MNRFAATLCVLAILLTTSISQTQGADDLTLPQKALEILRERCYRCHGGAAQQAGLDVLSRESLLQARGPADARFAFLVPNDAKNSKLAQAVKSGRDSYMPEQGSPEAAAMTNEEKDILQRWIDSGANFPNDRQIEFVTETRMLIAMRDYLLKIEEVKRTSVRFFTLAHLHNNPKNSALDLRLYRAALSKALNSLTTSREIVLPKAVPGAQETVYAVDLTELDWNRVDMEGSSLWDQIVSFYPYGLKFDFVKDDERKNVWKDVAKWTGADIPYLRADWFVVTATQPPLYHKLLRIPPTLSELEKELDIDIRRNFVEGKIERSGFAKSGVSRQNRLLERHSSRVTPYFWISYDFLPNRVRSDLPRFPLGPRFEGNPFNDQAFEHDGGELIWSLPNGMQAFMLVDKAGDRIDQGPIEVVFDRSAVLGTPSIINGISCIACHRHGLICDFRDELRDANVLGGAAGEHLQKTFPSHQVLQQSSQQDQQLFLKSLAKVMGPYLLTGADQNKDISQFPEPIGKVAKLYAEDLTLQEMAYELGLAKPQELEELAIHLKANRGLLRFGLGTMIQKPPGTLKRDKWQVREGMSLMQYVARELGIGIPIVP